MSNSFRAVVARELQRRDWSGYRLAKEAGLPLRGVQAFLAGEHSITSERLEAICRVLGLVLRPKGKGR